MYKRIIIKLSGETLAPEKRQIINALKDKDAAKNFSCTFDADRVMAAAETIKHIIDNGIQVGVVFGGGNIWRGRLTKDMNPVDADQMGMLATIINALAVQDALRRLGVTAKVFTAQDMPRFTDIYRADKALEVIENGGVALLAGGTGNPFFTTDSGAALRAAELKADAILKGTTVDGVYDKDPKDFDDAVLLKDVTFQEAIDRKLKVMDATAFDICNKQGVSEIRVFNMSDIKNVELVALGSDIGSRVHA